MGLAKAILESGVIVLVRIRFFFAGWLERARDGETEGESGRDKDMAAITLKYILVVAKWLKTQISCKTTLERHGTC